VLHHYISIATESIECWYFLPPLEPLFWELPTLL